MKSLVIGVSSYDTLIYIDYLPDNKSDYSTWSKRVSCNIGGTGAGKALALKTLGIDVTLATDLGEDYYGAKIFRFLDAKDLNLKVLKADRSTSHTNIMYNSGKRLSIFTSTPNHVEFDPSLEFLISSSDIIFLNINDYCREYITLIKKHNKRTIVDIHDYDLGNPYHQEFIDIADILFVSGININDQEKFLKESIKNKEIVIITNAEKGSIAIDKNNKIYHQKSYNVKDLVDTNGAGDSYSAGFVFKYLKTKSVEESLKFASICGALACESQELFNEKATEEYVESLMKDF